MDLEEKIENEKYFVHSYGQEEFYKFWDEYYDYTVEKYDFAVVLYDFITTQMNVFEEKKNFVIGFSTEPGGVLTEYVINMCEQYYEMIGNKDKRHYIRIFGRLDNAPLCPLNLEVRVDDSSEVYNFTLDDYIELPPLSNADYVNTRDELYGGLTVSKSVVGNELYINDILYANERDRAITLYEGTNYQHVDQQISLALNGYTTGQIEKLILKFSKYDVEIHEGVDGAVSTYIMTNNSSSEVFDGFYNTNCHTCATKNKAYGQDMITKSFNLNGDGTLVGYSSDDELTNLIVLRSVTAIIDQKHWLNNVEEKNDVLANYGLIPTSELSPGVNYTFLKEKNIAYNVYDLSQVELDVFKELYNTKNEEE